MLQRFEVAPVVSLEAKRVLSARKPSRVGDSSRAASGRLGDQGSHMLSEYLRQLALRCLSHSRDCFDLQGVERFRLLADDLLAKASELEENADSVSFPLPKTKGHGRPSHRANQESRGEG